MLATRVYSSYDDLPFLCLLLDEQLEGSRQPPFWRLDDVVVDERGYDLYVSDVLSACASTQTRTSEMNHHWRATTDPRPAKLNRC